MYKVFVNQRIIYLAENIDLGCIGADGKSFKCTNLTEIESAFSHFISEPAINTLFLYNPDGPDQLFKQFISIFSFIEAAGGLVKDPQNRLLFIYRFGVWDLPKGKIEKGEDAPMAALREVEEETGLRNLKIVKSLKCTYHIFERKGKFRLKRTYWFEMKSANNGPLYPQLEEDISEARWFSVQEIDLPLSNTYPAINGLVNGYLSVQM